MFRKKRESNATDDDEDEDQSSSQVRVFEYYESRNSSTDDGKKPQLYTEVVRSKLVKLPKTTTVAPVTQKKRRIRINTRPQPPSKPKTPTEEKPSVDGKAAGEADDLSDDKFFFDEMTKTKRPEQKTDDEVEIYHRPNVDKGVVFVQQDTGTKRGGRQGSKKPKDVENKPKEEKKPKAENISKEESDYEVVEEPEEDVETVDLEEESYHEEPYDDDGEDFEELNADFEIVDESGSSEELESREPTEFGHLRLRGNAEKRKSKRPSVTRGKHYVRQFESPQQLYAEIDRIINDKGSRNERKVNKKNYWEVRIAKPKY